MGRKKTIGLAEDVNLLEDFAEEPVARGWRIDKYKVTLRFLKPLLGTLPKQSIYTAHLASQQEKAMRKEGVSEDKIESEIKELTQDLELVKEGLTGFAKDEGGYYIRDYMVKAFFKNAAKVLKEFGVTKQLRSKVIDFLHPVTEKMYVAAPDAVLEVYERPLRAETPMGPRTAIARSEMVPAGTEIIFELHSINGVFKRPLIEALLSYGAYTGLGQNRTNGRWGSFEVVELEEVE